MPAKVEFSYFSEFLDELKKDYMSVDRYIVRVTLLHRNAEPFTTVFLVVTCIIEDRVVRCQERIGSYLGEYDYKDLAPKLNARRAAAEEAITAIDNGRLHIRAGVFREAGDQ